MADNVTYPTMLENPKNTYHLDLIEYSTELVPAWVATAEAIAGTVSSKEKIYSKRVRQFGFICHKCVQKGVKAFQKAIREGTDTDKWTSPATIWKRAFPKRCNSCKSDSSKYTRANKVFVRLDEIRMNEDGDASKNLKFCTFTHPDWNILAPHGCDLHTTRNILKTKSLKKANNWRSRNAWWRSREAKGQYWPECTVRGEGKIIDGKLQLFYRLHFHIHCILVSKYLDNKPIEEPIQMDSKFFREWGGIIDVRKVKDHQVPYMHKGEQRYGCGRKAVIRYLTKYISKAKGWSSGKIGEW